MVEPTLQEFVSNYWQEKWIDVSTIVADENLWATNTPDMSMMEEVPLPDMKSEIEKLRPVIINMTEWEMMNFVFEMIWEYNKLSQQSLDEMSQANQYVEWY